MEGDELLDLRRWWLGWMGATPAPLIEKMTLFWHGHFATSAEKVKDGYWMWRQNDTLRRHALGNFVALTKEMSRDPAMMIYLDLPQSRREHPNENWARELMELFTIGIGNYSEQDVRESARAFTGYRLNLATQQFCFARRQHDDGPKTFLGRRGNFNGDDVIDILTKQTACAQFIGKKLCRYFINDDPAPALVDAVAASLRAHNFEMKPVLREIFSSAEFYAPANVRSQIKSPAQFLIQTCKVLGCELPAAPIAQGAMRQMGQTAVRAAECERLGWRQKLDQHFHAVVSKQLCQLPDQWRRHGARSEPRKGRRSRRQSGRARGCGAAISPGTHHRNCDGAARDAQQSGQIGDATQPPSLTSRSSPSGSRRILQIPGSTQRRHQRRDGSWLAASDDEHTGVSTDVKT